MSERHNRVARAGHRSSKGQVMAIFALIAVLLFAVTGLAVDAGLSYLSYNGAERAAAAGALAGVPYMPNGFGGTGCSSGTADAAACAATARDGYANGSTLNGNPVTVTVARYPAGCSGSSCSANKLTVTVSAYVQPTFLRVLGFGAHAVVASDTAFYLPPISLGQPGAQLGSTEDQLGTAGNYYFLRSEGYGTDRGEGDAYDPNQVNANFTCQQGVTENSAPEGASTDVHTLSANLGTDVKNSVLRADLVQPSAFSAEVTTSLSRCPAPSQQGMSECTTPPSRLTVGSTLQEAATTCMSRTATSWATPIRISIPQWSTRCSRSTTSSTIARTPPSARSSSIL